jgi:hypothetical protein
MQKPINYCLKLDDEIELAVNSKKVKLNNKGKVIISLKNSTCKKIISA